MSEVLDRLMSCIMARKPLAALARRANNTRVLPISDRQQCSAQHRTVYTTEVGYIRDLEQSPVQVPGHQDGDVRVWHPSAMAVCLGEAN